MCRLHQRVMGAYTAHVLVGTARSAPGVWRPPYGGAVLCQHCDCRVVPERSCQRGHSSEPGWMAAASTRPAARLRMRHAERLRCTHRLRVQDIRMHTRIQHLSCSWEQLEAAQLSSSIRHCGQHWFRRCGQQTCYCICPTGIFGRSELFATHLSTCTLGHSVLANLSLEVRCTMTNSLSAWSAFLGKDTGTT